MALGMEKSDLYEMMPLVGIIVWVSCAKFFPAQYRDLITWSGFVLILMSASLVDLIYLKITGSCSFIDAVCDSFPDSNMRFYILQYAAQDQTVSPGYYSSHLRLKWPIKHPQKGKIQEIIVHHHDIWNNRFAFGRPGRALFQGEWFDHPSVAKAWLRELQREGPDIKQLTPIPIFELVRGNKDDDSPMLLAEAASTKIPGLTAFAELKMTHEEQKTLKRVVELEADNRELRRRSMQNQRRKEDMENELNIIKNELGSTNNESTDFQAAVNRQVLSVWEYFGGLDNLVKQMWQRKTGGFTVSKYLALTIIAVVAGGYFYMNPQVTMQVLNVLNSNWILALGGLLVAAIIGYIMVKRK